MRRSLPFLFTLAVLLSTSGVQPLPAISVADDEIVPIQVSPQTLILGWTAEGNVRVTVHADVSYGFFVGMDIDVWLGDVLATSIFPDSRGDLVAKFSMAEVEELVEVGTATLTLRAVAVDGTVYMGSDEVRVIQK